VLFANDKFDFDFTVAVRTVDLGDTANDAGQPGFLTIGYDLDDKCTGEGQGASCIEPSWASADHEDGPAGRDNAMGGAAYVINQAMAGSGTQLVNRTAQIGELTMVIRIKGYNGTGADDGVDVAVYSATTASGSSAMGPAWDGSDHWAAFTPWLKPLPDGDGGTTYSLDQPLYEDLKAYVTDGVLVADFDPLLVGAATYHLGKAHITGLLQKSGSAWSLVNGTVAGRLAIDDALSGLEFTENPPICKSSVLYPAAKALVCSYADIRFAGPDDRSSPCDAASWAWHFEAEAAVLDGIDLSALTRPCPPDDSLIGETCSSLP
jgi:hypothetical protein